MKGARVGLLLTMLGGLGYAQTVTITAIPSPLQSNFGSPNPQGTGAGESATIGAAPVPKPTVSAMILGAVALAFGAALRAKFREPAQIRNSSST
jgi:hypothetical protein